MGRYLFFSWLCFSSSLFFRVFFFFLCFLVHLLLLRNYLLLFIVVVISFLSVFFPSCFSSFCFLGTADGTVVVYESSSILHDNEETHKPKFSFKAHSLGVCEIKEVNGRVWSASKDNSIGVWTKAGKTVAKLEKHKAHVTAVSFLFLFFSSIFLFFFLLFLFLSFSFFSVVSSSRLYFFYFFFLRFVFFISLFLFFAYGRVWCASNDNSIGCLDNSRENSRKAGKTQSSYSSSNFLCWFFFVLFSLFVQLFVFVLLVTFLSILFFFPCPCSCYIWKRNELYGAQAQTCLFVFGTQKRTDAKKK